MGRNNDTFTLIINDKKQAWGKFRRGLRVEDQQLFDELWQAPKLHLAAGAFFVNALPLETIFMAMLLDQQKRIKRLEARLHAAEITPASIIEDIPASVSNADSTGNDKLLP